MGVATMPHGTVYVGYGDETAKAYLASARVQVGYGILLVQQTEIRQVENVLDELKKQFSFPRKEIHASEMFHPKMRIRTYGSKFTEAGAFLFTNEIIGAVKGVSLMSFCTGTVKKGQHKRTKSYMKHVSGSADRRIPIEFPPLNTKHYSRFCLRGALDMLIRGTKYNIKEVILDPETSKVENIIVNGKGNKRISSEVFLGQKFFIDDSGIVKEVNLTTIKREDTNLYPLLQLADLFSYLCIQFHTDEESAFRRMFIPVYEKLQAKIGLMDFQQMRYKRIA
jgi:hypothetical protein